MIPSFNAFLIESTKPGAGGILHIEHPSDRTFDGPEAASHAINTLRGAATGSTPITRKIDDKMSYQTIRTPDGRVGVKYKGAGAQYNFTPEDVDNQHGHKPYLAHPLKLLLGHLGKVLPKRAGEWQGGYMSDPSTRTVSKGRISHTPNTIEYSVPTNTDEGKKLQGSKVSTVIHSELKGPHREANPVTDTSEFRQHPDVHMVDHVVSSEEQGNIDPVKKRQILSHLDQADKLMAKHSHEHNQGHEATMRSYINSTVGSGETPSSEGYIEHLTKHHQKRMDAVKTQKSKDSKAAERDAAIAHVNANKNAFDRTFKIHGHVQQATNLLSRSLAQSAHGGYGHTIEGQETGPEGFVAGSGHGGLIKLVDRGEGGFTAGNNARRAIFKASPTLAKKI